MKNLYTLLLLLFISINAFGQNKEPDDYIYFAAGNQMKGKIESADEDKIKAVLGNGGRHTALRDKFLIFFNKTGNYITEKKISTDPAKAQQQITNFYAETLENKNFNDIIFKAIPREVIACKIKNELEDAINYTTLDGKSASINKDNLLAVIRHNGTYDLFREGPEVADNLTSLNDDFKSKRSLSSQVAEIPKQVSKPSAVPQSVQQVPVEQTTTEPVSQTSAPVVREKKKLTDEQQRIYKAKSVDRMEELASLLNDIVDNRRSPAEKDVAIKRALKMFIKDAKVEVSAVNNPNSKTNRDVGEYLTRLSRLNYSKVKITYAQINFVEEFEPDNEGNFWGLASYAQTFETNSFKDLTQKQQRIKLQAYEKMVDGAYHDKFDILLGNISINVSQ